MRILQDLFGLLGLGHNAKFERYTRAAEAGDTDAMYILSGMYLQGEGVPQDDAQAADWLRKAADAGNTNAMFSLGVLYYAGEIILQDYVQAHMWFNLSVTRGSCFGAEELVEQASLMAPELLDELASLMTPEQIVEAQRLAREWKPSGRKD